MLSKIKYFLTRFFSHQSVMLLSILLGLIAFFAIITPNHAFISSESICLFFRNVPEIALITIGMGLLLISGEFDLSVGSIYVFSAVIMAGVYTYWGMSLFVAIPIGIVSGIIMGTLNGFIVVKTKISSLIVTLGMMWAYRGIMLVLVGGYAIKMYTSGLESSFADLFTGNILGFPLQFVWLIIISIFLWLFLERTRFGNWVYSTGNNPSAAQMMGINTSRVKIICFAIIGFLCAFAGFLQVIRMSHAVPQSGQMTMLYALAGAVIGGTSLRGGYGNIFSCLFGAFIIQVIILGLIMLGFIEYYTDIVVAVALILTAYIHRQLGVLLR